MWFELSNAFDDSPTNSGYCFETCVNSNSTGVALPKIETVTFNLCCSISTSSTIPENPSKGPSVTLTFSPISNIIVDLGDARNSLHQGTISPCGRFYIVALEVGTKNEKYPAQDVVMIDLVKKTILKRVHAQHTEIDISVLSAFTCM